VTINWLLGSLVVGSVLGLVGGWTAAFVASRIYKRAPTWNGRTRGGRFGNAFLKLVIGRIGLRAGYFCLLFIIPYFYLFAPTARRSSNEYWSLRAPASSWLARQWLVMKHLYRFGQVLMDRLYQSLQSKPVFKSNPNGIENIIAHQNGVILLSAHAGAWDLAASLLRNDGVRSQLHVVHYESQGLTFNKVKGADKYESHRALVSNVEAQPVLKIRDILSRGSPIGLMGDRPVSGNFELVPFMGRLAAFDTTPFRLAASLETPLLFTFGFKGRSDVYDFFATNARIYRYSGESARPLQCYAWLTEFAAQLEQRLRAYPDQWFNFFPFWSARPRAVAEGQEGAKTAHYSLEELSTPKEPGSGKGPDPKPSAVTELHL
ncbi:MAG TPA: hypothetical protein VFV50_04535, partial [Bdellovibrionales bacterium]|nr:hypothetical protein [Bdellovibrionales bacterium]